jgi:hypothetical protein
MITNTVETTLDFNPEVLYAKLGGEVNRALLPLAIQIYNGVMQSDIGVPVATGNLKASFDIMPSQSPNLLGYQVGTPLNAISYAPYIEFGTRPHYPPFEPIRRWVELKVQPQVKAVGINYSPIHKRMLPAKKGTKVLKGTNRDAEIRRVTFAIIRHIAKFGTRAQRFMGNTLQRLGLPYTVYFTNVDSGYNVDVTEYLRNNLTELNLN